MTEENPVSASQATTEIMSNNLSRDRGGSMLRVAPYAILVALLGGCSSSESASGDSTAAPTTVTSNPACDPAPRDLLDGIEWFAPEDNPISVSHGVAYRSPDYQKVWFVAAEFTAPGLEPMVGVWVKTTDLATNGVFMSAEGSAKSFTLAPDASKTDAAIASTDPGVKIAKECLKAANNG